MRESRVEYRLRSLQPSEPSDGPQDNHLWYVPDPGVETDQGCGSGTVGMSSWCNLGAGRPRYDTAAQEFASRGSTAVSLRSPTESLQGRGYGETGVSLGDTQGAGGPRDDLFSDVVGWPRFT